MTKKETIQSSEQSGKTSPVLCIDIDGVLTNETDGWNYAERTPNMENIRAVRDAYINRGCRIILYTSRHEVDKNITIEWLVKHGCNFASEIVFGKPLADIYLDDRGTSDVNDLKKFGRGM